MSLRDYNVDQRKRNMKNYSLKTYVATKFHVPALNAVSMSEVILSSLDMTLTPYINDISKFIKT
jgi:hypothetical protein